MEPPVSYVRISGPIAHTAIKPAALPANLLLSTMVPKDASSVKAHGPTVVLAMPMDVSTAPFPTC